MKLKLNEQGFAVVQNGMPVYVHDDGKEIPFDAVGTVARITTLNGEAKTHREANEAVEAKLAAYKGIDDPAVALQALQTIKNIDDKKLVDAGKVEEVRAAAVRTYEERLKANETAHAAALQDRDSKLTKLQTQLYNEMIGGAFQRSKFVSEKVAIPADLLQAKFGQLFKVEDGKIVAFGMDGNRIYSRKRPGDTNVDFDEAIEIIVDGYENKTAILKGTGAKGSGTLPGSGGGNGGQKTMTRAAFDALDPMAKAAAIKDTVLTD